MGTQAPSVDPYAATTTDTFDERLASQKEIDDWLPVTSSRNAKWYYSAFHNVTAMVGAGVLSFPYDMAALGWGPGMTVLTLSWIITLYTLWQMVEMHEMVQGRRFDRYHELGQYAFGEKLGLYIVVPQQLLVEVGVNIVYMVTGGQSLQKFHEIVCGHDCDKMNKLSYFIMIFASAQFVLSHLPNFNAISGVSLAAAVMSFSYTTMAWVACLDKGIVDNVDYTYRSDHSTAGNVLSFFNALGNVAFAYAGHNVVLEIQATIPSTPEKPSKGPMWRGVVVAYIIVAVCYFPVAIFGYLVFGNQYVGENILITLNKPAWLIATANLFVALHLCGSYQIYAMAVFDMIETVLVRKLKFRPTKFLRFVVRNVYVACTMFVAITFPFFNGLLGFFGGFAFAPTTYFLPCIIWLTIRKPRRFSSSWWTNWTCILLGVSLMIVAPIGGLRAIIIKAKDYHFYS
ncbi:lysine histidine transporter 1-like [Neltuma alba]|uniref:lysine histidine transporter 1-like n=1 Tax=Neltuma alba TaxID=207710 RepID=UPI0010A4677B|nr:lysine histidine transporter 1-like [Prosopis alba]